MNYVEVLNNSSEIRNFTFVLYETHRPIAIVPLYVEKINGQFQISMGQEPVFAPIFNSNIVTSNISENIEYIVNQIVKKLNHLSPYHLKFVVFYLFQLSDIYQVLLKKIVLDEGQNLK